MHLKDSVKWKNTRWFATVTLVTVYHCGFMKTTREIICLEEGPDLVFDYLHPPWMPDPRQIKSIADVLKRRIRRLKHSVTTRHESVFSYPDVVRELSRLHENFVIVPADKASNNYTFVCKRHYVSILTEELGLNSLPGNPTCNFTDFMHQKCWITTNRSSLHLE